MEPAVSINSFSRSLCVIEIMRHDIEATYYNFNPGFIRPLTESSGFIDKQLQQKFAAEAAVYLSDEHELSPALALRYGLRLNQFNRLAQSGLERFANDQPITYNNALGIYQEATPIGTYSKEESTASFTNIEPRFTLAYRTKKSAWKASYQRVHQYFFCFVGDEYGVDVFLDIFENMKFCAFTHHAPI